MKLLLVFRSAQLIAGRAEEHDVEAGLAEGNLRAHVFALQDADHADGRRRIDGPSFRLVVEGDIAGDDRRAERVARVADSANAFRELPHDLRPLRRAEVEAI